MTFIYRGRDILIKSGQKLSIQFCGEQICRVSTKVSCGETLQKPVILTDYPKEIKAFYMKQNDDGKTVRAMDILFPKIVR